MHLQAVVLMQFIIKDYFSMIISWHSLISYAISWQPLSGSHSTAAVIAPALAGVHMVHE
jgi:hypothetical protein